MTSPDVLPDFTVRRSPRAKQVRITVTPRYGAVVVVPEALDDFDPVAAVSERREWILAALEQFADQRAAWLAEPSTLLPEAIRLPAIDQNLRVVYRATASPQVRTGRTDGRLTVSGAVRDAEKCLAALQRWLQAEAVRQLVPWIAQESTAAGLTPRAVSIRGQHARWGGCSPQGTITLNRALLFLEPTLVRSVMRHELAHLAEPNHSPAFWSRLELLDPGARQHHRAIAGAWDVVPVWAERR